MKNPSDLTPAKLFDEFRKATTIDIDFGFKAIQDFKGVKNKMPFLDPVIEFIMNEEQDHVRSWGTNVLEMVGGEKAIHCLVGLLNKKHTQSVKRGYRYTRFFALKALTSLLEPAHPTLQSLLDQLWQDPEEDYLVQAEAAILLARQGKSAPRETVRQMLQKYREDYWATLRALRALREFPLTDLVDDVIAVMRNSQYIDHQYDAIRALGGYTNDRKVVRALGDVILTDRSSYLRLMAVMTLARLRNPEARADLIHALQDENAEVRVQASQALRSFLSLEESVSAVAQQALRPDVLPKSFAYLVEALRQIDPDRTISSQVLSRELGGEDRKRAEVAEKALIDLGGWAAVQRLSQRRSTLDSLDKHLTESEQAIKATFQDTIRQARYNFYFAMGVNTVVVLVGLAFVVLAILQLIQEPEKLEAWLIPGGTGVIGVLINLLFNNPRQNARDDLASLMNVNVIFLGFLRQLNEIDATFKYAYIEDPDFGTEHMLKTVRQIETAVTQTLDVAARHLRGRQQFAKVSQQASASLQEPLSPLVEENTPPDEVDKARTQQEER